MSGAHRSQLRLAQAVYQNNEPEDIEEELGRDFDMEMAEMEDEMDNLEERIQNEMNDLMEEEQADNVQQANEAAAVVHDPIALRAEVALQREEERLERERAREEDRVQREARREELEEEREELRQKKLEERERLKEEREAEKLRKRMEEPRVKDVEVRIRPPLLMGSVLSPEGTVSTAMGKENEEALRAELGMRRADRANMGNCKLCKLLKLEDALQGVVAALNSKKYSESTMIDYAREIICQAVGKGNLTTTKSVDSDILTQGYISWCLRQHHGTQIFDALMINSFGDELNNSVMEGENTPLIKLVHVLKYKELLFKIKGSSK